MDKTEKLIDWKEDERTDRDRNGIDDEIEPPIPDVSAGSAKLAQQLREGSLGDPIVTGGDLDTNSANAQSSGEESAVGSSPTPDQNDVGKIGRAMGIEYADNEELKVGEKERGRDIHRWELDPASSDDYTDRVREEHGGDKER